MRLPLSYYAPSGAIFAPRIKQAAMIWLAQPTLSSAALEQTVEDDNVILAKSVIISREMADIRM